MAGFVPRVVAHYAGGRWFSFRMNATRIWIHLLTIYCCFRQYFM